MRKILFILISLFIPFAVVSQIYWGVTTFDSTQSMPIIRGNCSKTFTISYIKTIINNNTNSESDVLQRIQTSNITVTNSNNNLSYSATTPTITYKIRNSNQGTTAIISNQIPDPVNGSIELSSPQLAVSYTTNTQNITFTLALRTTTINTSIPASVLTSSISLNSITNTVNINYTYNTKTKKIQFSIPYLITFTATSTTTISIQSQNSSIEYTANVSNTTATITSNVFDLPIKVYTLQPITSPHMSSISINSSKATEIHETYLFKKANPGVLYISLGIIPSIANRHLLVSAPITKSDIVINNSKYYEAPIYNFNINGKIGIRLKRQHIIVADFTYLNQGFKTNYDGINPFTGKSDIQFNNTEYKLSTLAMGLGYSYNPYISNRHLNFASETVIYSSQDNNTIETYTSSNNRRIGFKAALGLSYKPNFRHDFKFMPTIYYDLISFTKNDISTRFYNLGFTFSYGISLSNF